jgi:hypothetical protein
LRTQYTDVCSIGLISPKTEGAGATKEVKRLARATVEDKVPSTVPPPQRPVSCANDVIHHKKLLVSLSWLVPGTSWSDISKIS